MTPLDIERITSAIQAVQPNARLIPPWLMRRAIRRHLELSGGVKTPHEFVFELPASLAQALVGNAAIDAGTDRIVLLPLPDNSEVSTEQVLIDCWRSLFHAAIDRAIDEKGSRFAEDRKLFNATILHEIRAVLEGEHRLVPPNDEHVLFREFAAFFLELRHFAPHLIEVYFPGFLHPESVAAFLEERINVPALLTTTRPPGAPEPQRIAPHESGENEDHSVAARGNISNAEIQRIASGAETAARKGNDVRAAISLQMIHKEPEAEEKLRSLVARLQRAIHFSEAESSDWFDALRPILHHAAVDGFWDAGERFLYDLQKACLDVERKTYAVDVIEWIVSLGKQRIKRLLEKPRRVNVLRHLRAASMQLGKIPIADAAKKRLDHLLHHAIHHTEKQVRDENRPILIHVLDGVGIVAENQAEHNSRSKMVEELLDTLCSRGFLKMSDLRDALARSRVKMNDLSGPKELLLGDPIIRANRKLALRMDGIYRRGEIYMRALQRLSSIGFGTKVGRLLVLWLILPFAASFVILSGVHEIVHVVGGLIHSLEKAIVGSSEKIADAAHANSILTSSYAIGLFGLFLLGLIHSPAFRRKVGIWARIAFIDTPSAIYYSPFVRLVFNNIATRFFARYLLLPLLMGGVVIILMRIFSVEWDATLLVGGGVALLMGTLFRTPFGRNLEERLDEGLARIWRIVSVNFVIGLLTAILQFFRWLFEWMERGMYAVDEWLRFREGESSTMLVFKLVFGFFWFFFTYLFRFAWNLLIEPQINPIKHFPVVTVSHKLILPLAFSSDFNNKAAPLASLLIGPFDMSIKTANTVASTVVWGIPGIFGFLVWELKENWRLYKANRSPVIGAIPVGSHGERVRGLLRPGFHSGVVPKTFAKLRKATTAGNDKKAAKHQHHLEHTAEAIEHLVEREWIACLKASRRWGGLPIHLEKVALATNRLRIFLTIHHWEGEVVISVEERGGWLIGSIEEPGWLGGLSDKQRAAFIDVLTELYKLSGVHVVREQIATVLGVEDWRIDCRPEGLLILPKTERPPVTIDYTDEPVMIPSETINGRLHSPFNKCDLVLSDCPLPLESWVERWELDHAGKAPTTPLLPGHRIAPQ